MLDDMQRRICRTQGDLYEWAADNKYIFPDFSDIYLGSSLCERTMDSEYSTLQLREPLEHMDFFLMERPDIESFKDKIKTPFSGEIAYWIGFLYRALNYETHRPSKELKDIYPFDKMLSLYPALHTVDYDMAVDIMLHRRLMECMDVEFYLPDECFEDFAKKHKRVLTDSDIEDIARKNHINIKAVSSNELTEQITAALKKSL